MRILATFKIALRALRRNKLRSGLTILGISIGISTVILISSAINGLNSNISEFVSALGTNDLWVFRFEPFGKRPTTEELNRKQLTYEDGIAMRSLFGIAGFLGERGGPLVVLGRGYVLALQA